MNYIDYDNNLKRSLFEAKKSIKNNQMIREEDIVNILNYANNVIDLINSSYHHYNLELKSIREDLRQECYLYLIEKGIKSYTPRANRDFALHLKYYLRSFLQQRFHSSYRFVAFPYSFIKQINKIKAKMNEQIKLTPEEKIKYFIFSSLSKKSSQTRIISKPTDFSMNLDNQIALNEAINSSLTKLEGDIIRLRYWNDWTQEKISKLYKCSKPYIYKIEKKALSKLKKHLGGDFNWWNY